MGRCLVPVTRLSQGLRKCLNDVALGQIELWWLPSATNKLGHYSGHCIVRFQLSCSSQIPPYLPLGINCLVYFSYFFTLPFYCFQFAFIIKIHSLANPKCTSEVIDCEYEKIRENNLLYFISKYVQNSLQFSSVRGSRECCLYSGSVSSYYLLSSEDNNEGTRQQTIFTTCRDRATVILL